MHIFPAIDVLGGRAVRLLQGDYDKVTVYNEDVVAQAAAWIAQGAQWLHIVDLDGARSGRQINRAVIAEVASTFPEVNIQVGGGIRTIEAARDVLEAGVARVILGTALVGDPSKVREIVEQFGPDSVVAGIDARDGQVAVEGWREHSGRDALHLAHDLADWGIQHLVFTDIARDGAQTGIHAQSYRDIADAAGFPVIVSGGVTSLDDIVAVRQLGASVAEGVIIGRALYEDNFTLEQALSVLSGDCSGQYDDAALLHEGPQPLSEDD